MKQKTEQKSKESKSACVWVEGDIAPMRAQLVLSGVTKVLSIGTDEIRVGVGKNEMIFCGSGLEVALFNESCLCIRGRIRRMEVCSGIRVNKGEKASV